MDVAVADIWKVTSFEKLELEAYQLYALLVIQENQIILEILLVLLHVEMDLKHLQKNEILELEVEVVALHASH